MDAVPLALILAIPLGAVAVGLGVVVLKRGAEWLDRALMRRWANALLRRVKKLPGGEDATADVTDDPPHPVLTVLGVAIDVVQEVPDTEATVGDALRASAGVVSITLPVVWLRARRQDGNDVLTFEVQIGARPSHKKLAARVLHFAHEVSRWDERAADDHGTKAHR